MKKSIYAWAFAIVAVFATQFHADAVLPITKVGMIMPDNMVYIDMATNAAKNSVSKGGKADGAVIISNSKSVTTGESSAQSSAVANAIKKAGENEVKGSTVYTINQPQISDLVNLSKLGAKTIYFVNGADNVVNGGVYPAQAYDETAIPAGLTLTPMVQLEYPDAQKLVVR
ncbi:MAG: hypothetical protein K2K88_01140 [Muribaculaceae bacterium]|nr:hypothetical protein [Muribaculaceae bacterium]MDE6643278.1 hypothetical protein [Muribaculaceae bacterium]